MKTSMWKYLRGYRAEAAAAPFMKLAEALLELYVPIYIAKVIDEGVNGGDSGAVVKNCVIIALFGLAGLLMSCTSQWFSARASVGYASALREDLFRKVVRISRSDADKTGRSALLTRLTSDTDKVQSGVNMGLRLLLRSPFVVFGSVIMAMTIDFKAGLIFLVTVAILSVIVFTLIYAGIPFQGRSSKQLEHVTSKVRDNLRGIRVIRAFGREDEEASAFEGENAANARATVVAGRVSSLMNPLTFAVVNIAIIVIVNYGAGRVSEGKLLSGDVVALYNYMGQILVELVKLANLTVTLSKAIACGKRIKTVLELPDEAEGVQIPGEISDSKNQGCLSSWENSDKAFDPDTIGSGVPASKDVDCDTPALEFRDVSFRYPGASADSLSHISFTLKKGESLGILGGTGSGKSTLANLIPALYLPTEGQIFVEGKDISLSDPDELRRDISAVPQHSKLFGESIADNIRRGKEDATDEEIRTALKLAAALDFSEEKGLDCEVLSGGSNFSGGQKQRLTIARALVRRAGILVLDDCLSALDFRTDLEVRRNIAGLEPKPATVIISQRPSTVLDCDRILVLDNGECAGYGTPASLYENCELYREIYDSQYSGKEETK